MTTAFPGNLDNFTNPNAAGGDTLASVPHDAQHSNENDAIEALERKVGIDGSPVTTSQDYLIAHKVTVTPASAFPFTAPAQNGRGVFTLYNTTGGGVTAKCPANPGTNQEIVFVDALNNAGASLITIDGNGNDISAYGSTDTTKGINANGGSITMAWDGTQWTQSA